ncbi:MAG: CHASE2 domain-containing protein [Candidatus Omnitrophica bacterium]|nr:CHASE2 domain-containing protein [Candidatus Omnitrophota bacterium]
MQQPKPPAKIEQKLIHYFTRRRRGGILSQLDWIQLLLCGLIIGLHVFLLKTNSLERVENIFLDSFFRGRPAMAVHPDIVLVEIDQDSLEAIGQWPWPWRYHAEMAGLLQEWQVKAAVFDLAFPESNLPYEDTTLEQALSKTEQDYLPVHLENKMEKKFWVHSLAVVLEPNRGRMIWAHSAPQLERDVHGLGHNNIQLDPDGVLRRIQPYLAYGGETYPHLALRVAYDYLGEPLPPSSSLDLPVDEDGYFFINWAGKWRDTFKHYSYSDLIRSNQALKQGLIPNFDLNQLRGKICLIGLSSPKIADLKVTPLEANYPTLGVYANVIQSVLTKRFVIPASFVLNLICLVAIGMVASVLFVTFRNVPSFIAGLALGGVWIVFSFLLFWQKGIWLYVFHPIILIIILFIFSAIYDHVVSTRERLQLFDLATRDGLTGLYVIRHFREILNQGVEEAVRKKEPLSLILIDIDNFKPINDTHGHQAGDMVLKRTAGIIFSCFRSKRPIEEVDFVARYGGEEFIVMLRKADLEDVAVKVAERIRTAVESAVFTWEDKVIPVTISLGVATLHPNESIPDWMVRRADEALYQAKRTGKNRVCTEKTIQGGPS